MNRQTLLLLILGIVFAAVLFVLFRLFLDTKNTGYTTEIAAAFMGALVTVVITMILLNRQSETEQLKERNVELLRGCWGMTFRRESVMGMRERRTQ